MTLELLYNNLNLVKRLFMFYTLPMRKFKFSIPTFALVICFGLASCSKNSNIDNDIVSYSISSDAINAYFDVYNENYLACRSKSEMMDETLYLYNISNENSLQYTKKYTKVFNATKYENPNKLYTECFTSEQTTLIPLQKNVEKIDYSSNIYELRFMNNQDIKIIYKIYKNNTVDFMYGALYKGQNSGSLIKSLFEIGKSYNKETLFQGTLSYGLNKSENIIFKQEQSGIDRQLYINEISKEITCRYNVSTIIQFAQQDDGKMLINAFESHETYETLSEQNEYKIVFERYSKNNYLYKYLGNYNEENIPNITNYIIQNNF